MRWLYVLVSGSFGKDCHGTLSISLAQIVVCHSYGKAVVGCRGVSM